MKNSTVHGPLVIMPGGTIQQFDTHGELDEYILKGASTRDLLVVLLTRGDDFAKHRHLTDTLREVAEKVVAACVAAKLTEPDIPLVKHDDMVDAFGKIQYQSAAQLAAAAKNAVANGSGLTTGISGNLERSNMQLSAHAIEMMREEMMKAFDPVKIQIAPPLVFNKIAISPNDFGVIKVDGGL